MTDHSLASCYENAFTIIVRLASMQRQAAPNADAFRTNIQAALKSAMEQAKALGYSGEINQLAFFALVALLDESVLKLQSPAFAAWGQQPLQEKLYGHNRAGEIFFDHLRTLLAQTDSHETADCLEVYALCMLLGFRGQYALSLGKTDFFIGQFGGGGGGGVARPSGDIQALIRQAREKIARIRGQEIFLRAPAPPPVIAQTSSVDRWSRGLGIAALALLAVVLISFIGFWVALSSGVTRIG
jgi:type VI secretion system protein ImpK